VYRARRLPLANNRRIGWHSCQLQRLFNLRSPHWLPSNINQGPRRSTAFEADGKSWESIWISISATKWRYCFSARNGWKRQFIGELPPVVRTRFLVAINRRNMTTRVNHTLPLCCSGLEARATFWKIKHRLQGFASKIVRKRIFAHCHRRVFKKSWHAVNHCN